MKNKFYTLKDFVFHSTPDTYPVVLKSKAVTANTNVDVYIDTLSGFIISSPNTCFRLSGALVGTDIEKATSIIAYKLNITSCEASDFFDRHIAPSIIKPSTEDLSNFFDPNDFHIFTNIISAEYKFGFRKGRTVLCHSHIPSIWLSANWTFLNGEIDFDKPELEGVHTTNIEKNKYVETIMKDLLKQYTSNFLNCSGTTINESC